MPYLISPTTSSRPLVWASASASEVHNFEGRLSIKSLDVGDISSLVDWRNCEACWSFTATGAIEGINKIVSGSLVSLFEQGLVDCDKSFNGCDVGLMIYVFQFVIKNHGIGIKDEYPYLGRQKDMQ